jgi:5'(3')-deoxyribonucleotidase
VSTAILLDADGVLFDTCTAMMRWAHALGADESITAETLTTYAIEMLLPEDKRATWWQRVTARGFCAALRPYLGAVEAVNQLREIGDVVVVTSPMHSPHWAHERYVSLRDHFGFDRHNVISTAGKHWVAGDFLCDDSASHLAKWSHRWGTPNRAFLIDRPYNAAGGCSFPRGSLADFVTYVRGYIATSAGAAAQ